MHSVKAATAAALAVLGLSAQAAMVTDWSYSVSTQWVTSGPGAPTFTTGGSNDFESVAPLKLSWGSNSGNVDPTLNSARSGLNILNSPQNNSTGGLATNDLLNPDLVATFQHVNNSISGSFDTLLSASVQATLTLTPFAPSVGAPIGPSQLTFDIKFTETANQAPCAIPETPVCSDIFVLTGGNLNKSFVYDGYTYYASFVDMQSGPLTPLSDAACLAANAPTGCLGFWTQEGATESIDFGIIISSQPINVPEPGMLALTGLGLLAAVGASRRRRQAA